MREAKAYGQHPVIERERFLTYDFACDNVWGNHTKGEITGMPESEARKRWVKENKQFYGFKMHKKNDEDIIKFLEGKQYATIIKLALREYMERHKEE